MSDTATQARDHAAEIRVDASQRPPAFAARDAVPLNASCGALRQVCTDAMISSGAAASVVRLRDVARTSDHILMARIAAGDVQAFEEIYRRYSGPALRQARALCASRELAEEIAQDAFVHLWRDAHRYQPALGTLPAWLSRIVRNRAIDAWRHASARPVEVTRSEDQCAADQSQSPSVDATSDERELMLSLIAALPCAQKEAIFLAYFGGMTQREIATWAGAPLGTIKGRLRLGVDKLRPSLEQDRPMTHALAA